MRKPPGLLAATWHAIRDTMELVCYTHEPFRQPENSWTGDCYQSTSWGIIHLSSSDLQIMARLTVYLRQKNRGMQELELQTEAQIHALNRPDLQGCVPNQPFLVTSTNCYADPAHLEQALGNQLVRLIDTIHGISAAFNQAAN
jgi:hypothetical protein